MRSTENRSRTDGADGLAVETGDAVDLEGHRGRVVAEEPVHALADDLRQRTDAASDDGRPAGERLDGDEAERLRPGARHQGRVALGEQAVAVGLGQLAEVLDARTGRRERRLEHLVVVGAFLGRRSGLGGDPQRASGRRWRSRSPRPAPLTGVIRPTKHSASPARRSNGAASSRRPLWTMPAQGTSGWVSAWFRLMATRPGGGSVSISTAQGWSRRPWKVVTTGTGATRASRRLAHSRWAWMRSNRSA